MTKLKFRAWDPLRQQIIRVSRLTWHGALDSGWLQVNLRAETPDREHVIMQYTGLDDSNGKEIWEGDVLRWREDERESRSSVVFDSGAFRESASGRLVSDLCRRTGNNSSRSEVIGNVHENPEWAEKE